MTDYRNKTLTVEIPVGEYATDGRRVARRQPARLTLDADTLSRFSDLCQVSKKAEMMALDDQNMLSPAEGGGWMGPMITSQGMLTIEGRPDGEGATSSAHGGNQSVIRCRCPVSLVVLARSLDKAPDGALVVVPDCDKPTQAIVVDPMIEQQFPEGEVSASFGEALEAGKSIKGWLFANGMAPIAQSVEQIPLAQ